ncbi:hypothetical protein Patl1_07132 [Pistacia atlantica]|uniref:Uncharacterized protein n=1 Tax=Pistacia atlantica TaxID=434234 RepID=A0ACC1AIZ0_9ROSI|nr:hypothetical protein Patl1_07132 [Pistacia atlantica]
MPKKFLTFHCRSNDDLGVKVLGFEKSWHFQFNKQFFESTIFRCNFSWPSQNHTFVIYYSDRDSCTYCDWYIRYSYPFNGSIPCLQRSLRAEPDYHPSAS